MAKFYRKLSWWNSVGFFFLYLIVWGLLTGIIGKEFYPIASWFLLVGFFANLIYLIKTIFGR